MTTLPIKNRLHSSYLKIFLNKENLPYFYKDTYVVEIYIKDFLCGSFGQSIYTPETKESTLIYFAKVLEYFNIKSIQSIELLDIDPAGIPTIEELNLILKDKHSFNITKVTDIKPLKVINGQ